MRVVLQDSRQDLKVTGGYILSSYIMYYLVRERLDPPEQLKKSPSRSAAGLLPLPFASSRRTQLRMRSMSFTVYNL